MMFWGKNRKNARVMGAGVARVDGAHRFPFLPFPLRIRRLARRSGFHFMSVNVFPPMLPLLLSHMNQEASKINVPIALAGACGHEMMHGSDNVPIVILISAVTCIFS